MLSVSINVVYFMLSLALLFAFIRLTRGPSLPDRVVALELITSIVVGYVDVHAIETGVASLLTAFLAAIGFARFVERGGVKDE